MEDGAEGSSPLHFMKSLRMTLIPTTPPGSDPGFGLSSWSRDRAASEASAWLSVLEELILLVKKSP